MSNHQKAFMFGYSKNSAFVAQELQKERLHLSIILSERASYEEAKADGYVDISLIDMTDDEALEQLAIQEDDHIICMMEDNHLNVFLTLSLHALFPHTTILALSDSPHTTQKLQMAGASKIIDLYQVSANRLHNILNKPVTTKLIERLFSPEEDFSFKEMVIPKDSFLDKVMVDDFDFSQHKIILVGMIDLRLSEEFVFITSGLEHRFDSGDTIVCIGYNDDLEAFEKYITRVKGDEK